MKTFLTRFDKEHLSSELDHFIENLSPQEQQTIKRINIKLDPDEEGLEVEVNLNCSFWELMRKSSIALNLKMSEFYILTKQGPLEEDVYNKQML